MRDRIEKFRGEHAGGPIGDVANRVLFEDDNMRIWERKREAGEHSDLHHHEHADCFVIQSGELVAGVPPKSRGIDPFVGRIPSAPMP